MEITVTAKTIEAAVKLGAEKLGRDVSAVQYTVIEDAKKGLFGIGSQDAKVTVFCNDTAEDLTIDFINTLLKNMEMDAKAEIVKVEESIPEGKTSAEKDIFIEINGTGLGLIIGRHGEVLDSLQYLANIVASRAPKDDSHQFVRVIIDVENYRAKRQETLKTLAKRIAQKVLESKRNYTLEPMSAYERRIIHSEIQDIANVYTYSIGADSDRRVVVAYGTMPEENETYENE